MVCCRFIIRHQLIQFAAFQRYLVARIIDTNYKFCQEIGKNRGQTTFS